jgi:hypothetical protein
MQKLRVVYFPKIQQTSVESDKQTDRQTATGMKVQLSVL